MFAIGRPLDDFRRPQVSPRADSRILPQDGAAEHVARGKASIAPLASEMGGICSCGILIPDYRLLISDTVELLAPTTVRVRPHEQRCCEVIAYSRCESVCVRRLAGVGFSSGNAPCAALQRETGQPD